MRFHDKNQILIITTAVLIAVGFIFLRYVPLHVRLKAVKAELYSSQQVFAKAEAESEELGAIRARLEELKNKAGNYELSVPSSLELGGFLQELAGLMDKQNLREQQIQPGEKTQVGGLKGIPVNMKCRGTMSQMFEFFRTLQSLNRAVRVEHVQLVNTSDYSGDLSMETRAMIFYRAPDGK
ncbi:MAG: hypothetical protein E4H40_05920 [Candidatus Brocadiia bacterium]|nr:MAG: hypothetical protein E4H40_05920 [Candidatus Brocadiia bacterium]